MFQAARDGSKADESTAARTGHAALRALNISMRRLKMEEAGN